MVMLMIRQCEAVLLGIVGDISQLQVLVEEGSVIFMFFVQDFFRQRAPGVAPYCTLSTEHSAVFLCCIARGAITSLHPLTPRQHVDVHLREAFWDSRRVWERLRRCSVPRNTIVRRRTQGTTAGTARRGWKQDNIVCTGSTQDGYFPKDCIFL